MAGTSLRHYYHLRRLHLESRRVTEATDFLIDSQPLLRYLCTSVGTNERDREAERLGLWGYTYLLLSGVEKTFTMSVRERETGRETDRREGECNVQHERIVYRTKVYTTNTSRNSGTSDYFANGPSACAFYRQSWLSLNVHNGGDSQARKKDKNSNNEERKTIEQRK